MTDSSTVHVLTPLEREIAIAVKAGGALAARLGKRWCGRHEMRAVNRLFSVDVFTDVDPADGRRAIGGIFLTPAGLVALDTPTPPWTTPAQRRVLQRFADGRDAAAWAASQFTHVTPGKPGRLEVLMSKLADAGLLDWSEGISEVRITPAGLRALKRRFR